MVAPFTATYGRAGVKIAVWLEWWERVVTAALEFGRTVTERYYMVRRLSDGSLVLLKGNVFSGKTRGYLKGGAAVDCASFPARGFLPRGGICRRVGRVTGRWW